MCRYSQSISALLVAVCCLSTVAGCATEESSGTDLPDGGPPQDGGVDPGDAGSIPDASQPDAAIPDGGTDPDGGSSRFHPDNFAEPEIHGLDLRLGAIDCRLCHGADLTGRVPLTCDDCELSCDTCHTPADPKAWRTDCVFCHGGVEDLSGGPPKNLDGTLTVAESVFPPHHDHINTAMTEPLDCRECHVKAADVLSVGHVFDDTPGTAEVDLGGGRSPRGTYDPDTGCAILYCHGTGQGDNGSVAVVAPPMTCESCHAGSSSSSGQLAEMSGLHGFHVSLGAG